VAVSQLIKRLAVAQMSDITTYEEMDHRVLCFTVRGIYAFEDVILPGSETDRSIGEAVGTSVFGSDLLWPYAASSPSPNRL